LRPVDTLRARNALRTEELRARIRQFGGDIRKVARHLELTKSDPVNHTLPPDQILRRAFRRGAGGRLK
jgi:hypothetical protein